MSDLRLVLVGVIIIVLCLIIASVLVSVIRRVGNKRRYETLDRLRDKFRPEILNMITSGSIGSISEFVHTSKIRAGSLEWIALEEVLFDLSEEEGQKNYARKLLDAFGYAKYYHNQLSPRGSSITLSAAADKLGRIGDPSAVEPLFNLLSHKKSEVATVAFRALCRIGTNNAFHHVLFSLPALLKDRRITVKAIQTSLLLFGPWTDDLLLQYAGKTDDPEILAVILETLTAFPAKREIFDFALTKLAHPDPEVRGKALRVVARVEKESFSCDPGIFLPLLNDPVWFVRLQTAKTIGKLKCENFIEMLKKLALDERWQVRDAATLSLLEAGEASVDAFLELLETPDRYAKESISEEIQRTGFVLTLIEYLDGADLVRKTKAERILTSMHKVGFSTPLREAVNAGISSPRITAELTKILLSGGVA
jgi:HEAT repeat protein